MSFYVTILKCFKLIPNSVFHMYTAIKTHEPPSCFLLGKPYLTNCIFREWEWTISSDSMRVCLHQSHPDRITQWWQEQVLNGQHWPRWTILMNWVTKYDSNHKSSLLWSENGLQLLLGLADRNQLNVGDIVEYWLRVWTKYIKLAHAPLEGWGPARRR